MRAELKETTSPSYGPEDPVKKKPPFQSKPDRKHSLFAKHEVAAAIIETNKVKQAHMWSHLNLRNTLAMLFYAS